MKSQFQAKFLQHLAAKKKENEGFTLIELLVVVIIIGVLAAIALPNLLGQVGKARESEAKNTVGSLNRAQQVYHLENQGFAVDSTGTDVLEVPTTGKYYSFTLPSAGVQLATGSDNTNNGTRDYVGGISYNTGGQNYETVLCRADDPTTTLGAGNVDNEGVGTADAVCGTNTSTIQ